MPYREKTAWLSLIAIALSFGPYFALLASDVLPRSTAPIGHQLGWYAATVVVDLVILGVGHLYLRWKSPGEWREPADERDLAIQQRSVTIAYYVLMTGMILVGCFMPFGAGGMQIVSASIFGVVVAEVVRYSLMVTSYRRQS